ncbi:AbrB/MazE/SpoVT family DNA-binding domain-containing protein [Flavisphingomonas formosensis]|uniref:AbrB/MazE/SpoVT family DNA-binding domain-containing protein n=1 Tax=Flavisphingomonas formosensis TaxID=861534 RepID=UPI0012FA53DF|nr:AbrB/MazE/SpoVT family DNA-binding domain-containing protein [Sphingomonas formosensis]
MGKHDRLTTIISTKGQVILPKAIRDLRHWTPGTKLTVEDTPDGVLLKASPLFPPSDVETMFGSMRHDGPALSIDEMNEAIAREAERRARD